MKKEIISNLESEKDICETLNGLIKEITNEKLLTKIEDGEFLKLIFGKYINGEFSSFEVKCEPMKDYFQGYDVLYLKEDSDAAFFEAACSFPESTKLVVDLLHLIIKHNLDVGKYAVLYRDEEQVFGLTLAIALLRSNSKYCKLYGAFLKTLDTDHTVHEYMGLLFAFEKYGCNLDSMELLAVSLFSASGQHSEENLSYLLEEYPINQFLESQTNLDATYEFMLDEFKQVHNNNKEFYSNLYIEVCEENENLKTVLNKIETHYNSTI
ncbi:MULTISPECIES: hypothetical protein [Flavobacterium]|uniref:Uncharacterized protein n=1 Tax=Flavobacterium jumunjinense TaxID=998845 RepID=A0ABV5GNU1_9FLAO|nr:MULTISPECIES: hypothetical protein [Flavobacterium]